MLADIYFFVWLWLADLLYKVSHFKWAPRNNFKRSNFQRK